MGNLKPGATYVYERVDGTVYQREIGADPLSREAIGWDYDPRTEDGRPLHDHMMDSKLWGEIRRAAKENPLLQEALDRVKIIYELSKKDNGQK
jgi:hypothetical protein